MGNVLYLLIFTALFIVALMVTLLILRLIPRLFRSRRAQEQAEDSAAVREAEGLRERADATVQSAEETAARARRLEDLVALQKRERKATVGRGALMILEIAWSLLAFGGLVRAIYLARESVIDRRALGTAGNGRRLLANWQVEHAIMGVAIYLCLLFAGFSALGYRFEILPLHMRLILASGL